MKVFAARVEEGKEVLEEIPQVERRYPGVAPTRVWRTNGRVEIDPKTQRPVLRFTETETID